ncbi:hypothetical protein ABT126_09260 [Streptomyces sp. NPDC002012]|uniref:hypothetical protein n=1 Tax=unclassified Streptomyces TaxID=2593676 RepID=UPI00333420E5
MNKLVVATSDQSQVIKSGQAATFYTPQADGKQVSIPGEYKRSPRPLAWGFFMERATRIELAL